MFVDWNLNSSNLCFYLAIEQRYKQTEPICHKSQLPNLSVLIRLQRPCPGVSGLSGARCWRIRWRQGRCVPQNAGTGTHGGRIGQGSIQSPRHRQPAKLSWPAGSPKVDQRNRSTFTLELRGTSQISSGTPISSHEFLGVPFFFQTGLLEIWNPYLNFPVFHYSTEGLIKIFIGERVYLASSPLYDKSTWKRLFWH